MSDWKPRKEYLAEKERKDIAARKVKQESTHDPVVEQCVIDYVNHRAEGGSMLWQDYRRQWYFDREKREAAKLAECK